MSAFYRAEEYAEDMKANGRLHALHEHLTMTASNAVHSVLLHAKVLEESLGRTYGVLGTLSARGVFGGRPRIWPLTAGQEGLGIDHQMPIGRPS